MKKLVSIITAIALWCAVLPVATVSTTGCTKSQITSLLNTLGTYSASIATIEGDASAAATIKADTAAAVAAVNGCQSGGTAAQIAIQALNLLAADIDLIPGTSQYALLITLSIGTIDAILALIPAPAAAANVATVHRSRIVTLTNAPKTSAEFKAQWNAIATANGLTKAKK